MDLDKVSGGNKPAHLMMRFFSGKEFGAFDFVFVAFFNASKTVLRYIIAALHRGVWKTLRKGV